MTGRKYAFIGDYALNSLLTSLNGIHIHIHPLLPHSIGCAMSFVNVSLEEVYLKQHYCSYHLLDIDPGKL